MTGAVAEIDRPLRVGELLAASVRIFNDRAVVFIALGLLEAGALVAAAVSPIAVSLAVLSVSFAAAFAVTVRLIVGDSLREAVLRAGQRAPVLVPLAVVVAAPFYLLGSIWLEFLVLAIGWLALAAFAIPVAMVEEPADATWPGRVSHALRRTVALARAEYVHALVVAGAIVLIYIVVGVVLAVALASFADNGRVAAQALAQVVLAPFFFIGLTVLYFEQQARARLPARPREGSR